MSISGITPKGYRRNVYLRLIRYAPLLASPRKRSLVSLLLLAVLAGTPQNPTTPSNPSVDRNEGSRRVLFENMVKIIKTASCQLDYN
jgi:hypothetical protein